MESSAGIFRRGQGWLRDTSWSYLFGLAFFVAVVSLMLSIGAEAGSVRAALARTTKAVIGVLLFAKLLSGGYGGLDRYRAAVASRAPFGARLGAFLPPGLLAWPRMDRANLVAGIAWLRRQPHPQRPAGIEIGFIEKSSYSTLMAIDLPDGRQLARRRRNGIAPENRRPAVGRHPASGDHPVRAGQRKRARLVQAARCGVGRRDDSHAR